MEKSVALQNLTTLLEKSTSPFHTISIVEEELKQNGFQALSLRDQWKLERGGKYFVSFHGTSLFSFVIGEDMAEGDCLRMAAGHGDFPGFRIKPNPDQKEDGYRKLNTEVYGGVNVSSWMDRPLSVAGRVALKSGDVFAPKMVLVDVKDPCLVIPSCAVHLVRELSGNAVELNKQIHMAPIFGSVKDKKEEKVFLEYLAGKLGVDKEDILDYELNIYNAEAPLLVGGEEEFISAPRLDDLTSVFAIVEGMKQAKPKKGIAMGIIFDHEEIGSQTKQGAQSNIFPIVLEKIFLGIGLDRQAMLRSVEDSLLLSVDVAQGVHPNYKEKYDPTNRPILNGGFCIKEASKQSYATDCEAIGIMEQLCQGGQIAYQKCVNRSDMPSGGTLGSIASAVFPVRTVDMGVPLLSMHSARELAGVQDVVALAECISAFYTK